MKNRKLILFIHGLGGGEETWGEFPKLIENHPNCKEIDVALFTYDTSLIELSSVGGLVSRAISSLLPQTLLSWASKVLPLALPTLPKIQEVADILKGKISLHYEHYEEIYLVAHSMGGLVARQYLNDMILNNHEVLKVRKLMLYAVPNNGSSLAKVSNLYGHTQIKQLDVSNDFITQLNRAIGYVDLSQIEVRYVAGRKDIAVSENSAIGEHSNRKYSILLDKTHFDIVKPTGDKDDSFLVLQKFIDCQTQSEVTQDNRLEPLNRPISTPFTQKIITTLLKRKLITLFSQDFSNITRQQTLVRESLKEHFNKEFHHLSIPPNITDEATYFSVLADALAFDLEVNSLYQWERELTKKLEQNPSQKIALFVTGIEDGDQGLSLDFARTTRRLLDAYPNIYVIVVGKKRLASLVEGKNSKLSPFNSSEKFFFENAEPNLTAQQIRQEFQNLKGEAEEICLYMDEEQRVKWYFYMDSILHRLFWGNLMVNRDGFYDWRDAETKSIAKEVLGC